MAAMAGWPPYQWTTILAPYLMGPIQLAVDTLPVTEAWDYDKVKRMILSTLNVSKEPHHMRLRATCYDQEKGARWAANLIRSHGMIWLKPQEKDTEEVVELIWLEQFIAILPSAAQAWVLKHTPQTLEEAVGVMESYKATEKIKPKQSDLHGEVWKGGGNPRNRPREVDQPRPLIPSRHGRRMEPAVQPKQRKAPGPGATFTPKGAEGSAGLTGGGRNAPPHPRREAIRCFRCGVEGHV